MNSKVINISEANIFPFKTNNKNAVSIYYILKLLGKLN